MENQTNQTNQTKTLKETVEEIIKSANRDTVNYCFFEAEGLEPFNGKFYYAGQEDTYNALQEAGITVEFADRYGGEGKGDDYWSVYKFSKGDEAFYVKFDGWYASYNGSEFNEWFFVEPKQVQVVKFQRRK